VEDDIYRELAARGEASLAAMDGLRRVIRVGSFSKTLSPVLRVGSICASNSLVPELLRVKMLAGLTTSEINERAVYHAISARPYKRMVDKLVASSRKGANAPSNAWRRLAWRRSRGRAAACSSAPAGRGADAGQERQGHRRPRAQSRHPAVAE
jgi:DNA-binding transcriptional MocR family regulator